MPKVRDLPGTGVFNFLQKREKLRQVPVCRAQAALTWPNGNSSDTSLGQPATLGGDKHVVFRENRGAKRHPKYARLPGTGVFNFF